MKIMSDRCRKHDRRLACYFCFGKVELTPEDIVKATLSKSKKKIINNILVIRRLKIGKYSNKSRNT